MQFTGPIPNNLAEQARLLVHVMTTPGGPEVTSVMPGGSGFGGVRAGECFISVFLIPILQMKPRLIKEMIAAAKMRPTDPCFVHFMEHVEHLKNVLISNTTVKLGKGLADFLQAAAKTNPRSVDEILNVFELLGLSTFEGSMTALIPKSRTPLLTDNDRYIEGPQPVPIIANGDFLAPNLRGDPLLASFKITDTNGHAIMAVRATITMPYPQACAHPLPLHRRETVKKCAIEADDQGRFFLRTAKPMEHTLSENGLVGALTGNHIVENERPGTLLFQFQKGNLDLGSTALYIRGKDFDEKYGSKANSELVVDLKRLRRSTAEDCQVPEQDMWQLKYTFALTTPATKRQTVTEARLKKFKELTEPVLKKNAMRMLTHPHASPSEYDLSDEETQQGNEEDDEVSEGDFSGQD